MGKLRLKDRHVMSCHGMSAWVVFGLATLPYLTIGVLQVRFHDDIDGSSLAHAIYASTGPLLLPSDSGFRAHSKPLGHDFPYEKDCPQYSCFQLVMA